MTKCFYKKYRKTIAYLLRGFGLSALCFSTFFLSGCMGKIATAHYVLTTKKVAPTLQICSQQIQSQGGQIIKLGETVRIVLPDEVLFNTGSANFIQLYMPVLDAVVAYMNLYQVVDVQVSAYTDNVKGDKNIQIREKNLTDSQAQSVQSYLWHRGVNVRMIQALGFGDANPVASNTTEQGRSTNRRVEISFRFYPRSISYM